MASTCATKDRFGASRERFEELVGFMAGERAGALSHAELESRLATEGRELLRQLYQDHLDLRAVREVRWEVVDAEGTPRRRVEPHHHRSLHTVFGALDVERLAYRRPGRGNLHPADGALNLPRERHSHGLRALAAVESTRGSFEEAAEAIGRATGQAVAKRQVEALARRAATDVETFYDTIEREPANDADVLVISVDGKGIVMRPDALRPATERAAAAATNKLETRLSKGEKRNRKRMAEVGAVYDLAPVPRSPIDVLARKSVEASPAAPKAKGKWVTASVAREAAEVVGRVFEEACRRDPRRERRWVALVDGNNHQIERIKAEAGKHDVKVAIVVDLVHVLEYLWGAVWCFFAEGDPAAEGWVRDRALAVLQGQAGAVAAGVRRRATRARLARSKRTKADECARYLTNKAAYLDYPAALAAGWPVATGVIEGTCRYLVADRMDVTGARWSVDGAEAVLKLRAVRANDDWEAYWHFHQQQELRRVHTSRYLHGVIPHAA
jgi:hypothetical protein